MMVFQKRVLAALLFGAVASLSASAENYQCTDAGGCSATTNKNGKVKTVRFRRGDIIDTESGWVVNPTEGWEKMKKKKEELDR